MSDMINKENKIVDSKKDYIPPEYQKTSFHCPHCRVYAKQNWYDVCKYRYHYLMEETRSHIRYQGTDNLLAFLHQLYSSLCIKENNVSACDCCKKYSIWVNAKMVYPHLSTAPLPNVDMPKSVKELYNEARDICSRSPRGACALLRFAIQLLVKELDEKEKNLSKAIGNLVKKGLSNKIQKALDVVRVIGNNAIHPGQIDIKDNPELVNSLFMLVNFICEKMITENKDIDAIYNTLPSSTQEAVKERDKKHSEIRT